MQYKQFDNTIQLYLHAFVHAMLYIIIYLPFLAISSDKNKCLVSLHSCIATYITQTIYSTVRKFTTYSYAYMHT